LFQLILAIQVIVKRYARAVLLGRRVASARWILSAVARVVGATAIRKSVFAVIAAHFPLSWLRFAGTALSPLKPVIFQRTGVESRSFPFFVAVRKC